MRAMQLAAPGAPLLWTELPRLRPTEPEVGAAAVAAPDAVTRNGVRRGTALYEEMER